MNHHTLWTRLALAAFGALLSLLLFAAGTAYAQSADFVVTSAPAGDVELGTSDQIVIQAQNVDLGLAAVQLYLTFDPAVINVTGLTVNNVDFPTNFPGTPAFDNGAGTIDWAAGANSPFPTGTIALITIDFEAVGVGSTDLTYTFVQPRQTLAALDGNNILNTPNAGAPIAATITVVDSPLAIVLDWFEAQQIVNAVEFRWQTLSESATAGFNILAEVGDVRQQLNQELIPSKVVDSTTPTAYEFTAVTGATWFYLQEVKLNGGTETYGPFELIREADSPGDGSVLPMAWLPMVMEDADGEQPSAIDGSPPLEPAPDDGPNDGSDDEEPVTEGPAENPELNGVPGARREHAEGETREADEAEDVQSSNTEGSPVAWLPFMVD